MKIKPDKNYLKANNSKNVKKISEPVMKKLESFSSALPLKTSPYGFLYF